MLLQENSFLDQNVKCIHKTRKKQTNNDFIEKQSLFSSSIVSSDLNMTLSVFEAVYLMLTCIWEFM